MAKVDYDAAKGLGRLSAALEGLDHRMPAIIASHIALEREVLVVLDRTLRRADFVKGLGYAQKVNVLAASWIGEDIDAVNVSAALHAFGELRNRIAHGNVDKIEAAFTKLRTAYQALYPDANLALSPEDIAGGIIAFFGDAPSPEEIRFVAEGMERVMSEWGHIFERSGRRLTEIGPDGVFGAPDDDDARY